MYKYTFSNEDTEELTNKTKKYSELVDKFKDVDKKFSSNDDTLDLQEKTFTKLSDDDIKSQAENKLYDYKQSGISGIEKEYSTKQQNIEDEIDTLNDNATSKKNETKQLYSSLKDEAKNDALKRGLARSSIVINVLDAFDNNMIKAYEEINNEITAKVESLNHQKSLLNEQKQNALNAFDLTYAVKLSEKIDSINADLLEQEQKIIEYNNKIREQEAKFEEQRKQNALDYAEYIEKYGSSGIEKAKQEEKLTIAKEYLASLSLEDAKNELNTNRLLSSELGPSSFNKLKLYMERREK